jgi:hypothetical protein
LSPLPVPTGYPFYMDDAELEVAIDRMIKTDRPWVSFDTLLPELQLGIIAADLQEQIASRDAAAADIHGGSNARVDRVARQSLFIAKVALWIAAVTFVASVVIPLVR